MHLTTRNVNTAFSELTTKFRDERTVVQNSRNGNVLLWPEPVMVTYEQPKERVLVNYGRNCNPFFHLFESLWMLAGRHDLKPLSYYIKDFIKYSDDGHTLNGAYGFRWRNADTSVEPRDQIEILIEHLRDNPNSRRAVLQMWNVEDDLMNINDSKDVCCNLSITFHILYDRLHMTVFNRSNDLIYGMLGANAVHFSILQEYVACSLGIPMGTYTQCSANLHAYMDTWNYELWNPVVTMWTPPKIEYGTGLECYGKLLFKNRQDFDLQCQSLIDNRGADVSEPFLKDVVQPMLLAHQVWKDNKDFDVAMSYLDEVDSADWKIAGCNWMLKRKMKEDLK